MAGQGDTERSEITIYFRVLFKKMSDHILKKVKDTISQYRMISPGDLIVVAVSGGPDSICLLDVLNRIGKEMGLELIVAHFNHGLRPEEDEIETQFVKDFAEHLNLPFVVKKADSELKKEGSSLEELARKARYNFLESVRALRKADRIAVGHTMNDQAETVIMRLLRGSGPSGLAGIPPIRDGVIIRPLLNIKGEEVEEYIKEQNLTYMIDSSNLKLTYLRNRIRLEILPILTQLQPNLIEQLALTADILRGENEYLDSLAEAWIQNAVDPGEQGLLSIPLDLIQTLPSALKGRVLRALIKKIRKNLFRIEYDHVLAVSDLINSQKPQGRLDLPDGLVVTKVYDSLEMSMNESEPQNYQYTLEGPGCYHIDEIDRTLTLTIIKNSGLIYKNSDESISFLDADKIHFPILVRNFRPGDRFIPLGMDGHKKVKDFFIDLKVPDKKRYSVPVLIYGKTPIWLCGYRIDDRFKVTPSTKRTLRAVIDLI